MHRLPGWSRQPAFWAMEAPKTAIVMGPPEVSCENSVCSPRVLPRNVIPRSSEAGGRVRAEDSMPGGFETVSNVSGRPDGFKTERNGIDYR